jgi:hypothetical protein
VLYELLLPWAAVNVVDTPEGIRGSVSRYLAILASLLKRPKEAARHFEDALDMNQRMGAMPWLAQTQEEYGRMLLEEEATDRGSELITAALETYRELGMESHAARAQVLVESQAGVRFTQL